MHCFLEKLQDRRSRQISTLIIATLLNEHHSYLSLWLKTICLANPVKSTKLMQCLLRYLQIQKLHAKTFQQLYEDNLKPHQPTKAILSVRVQNIKQTVV